MINNHLISGYIVGLGKICKDGSTEYRELERPIKNMIVKQGLNKWFTHNGSNSAIYQKNNPDIYPTFAIRAMSFGSSGDSNNFATTTELVNRSVAPYETLYGSRNWPYQGVKNFGSETPVPVAYRWTTQSPTVAQETNIKEIGIYKKENSNYYLFARVVLPWNFTLYAGESFVCTYEIRVTFPNRGVIKEKDGWPDLFNANGQTLTMKINQEVIVNGSGNTSLANVCTSVYSQKNDLNTNVPSNTPFAWGPYSKLNDDGTGYYGIKDAVFYKTSPVAIPTIDEAFPTGYSIDSGAAHPIITIQNYVPDTFERSIIVRLPQLWPNMTDAADTIDIHYLNFRTLAIRFGYYDSDNEWVDSAWRKRGADSFALVFKNIFKTQDAIDWLDSQTP